MPPISVGVGRILLVEDDDAMRLTIGRALREAGHMVENARDGRECLELFRVSPPDLVLMDIYLPNKDGLETLLDLRRDFPTAVVIAMSGHRKLDLMLRAAKGLGAVLTLAKPFTPEELLAVVAEELDWAKAGAHRGLHQRGDETSA